MLALPFRPAVATLVLLAIAACAEAPLLSSVVVEPAAITPNGDGDADVARIAYAVGQRAQVTIELVGPDGHAHVVRDQALRQPRDDYAMLFGGTIDGRMLPDGAYAVRITAEPVGGGPAAEAEAPLAIQNADASPPELVGFAVHPDRFTPNQDGLDDRVRISYRLDEPADVRIWLEHEDGTLVGDILGETEFAVSPGEVGPHAYEYDAGVDADAPPPPDGQYAIVGEARDEAGNVATARAPLRIEDGGQARAALVGDLRWSATLIPLGETLRFTATVRNDGDTPIRTRGPEPGAVYDNSRSYNAVAPAEWLLIARASDGEKAASARVPFGAITATLDLGRAAEATQAREPLHLLADSEDADRAALAALEDLQDDARLCGTVVDGGRPVAGAVVWRFEADGDNGLRAVADGGGAFCFDGLIPTPAYQRSFARSSGAVRLGIEYEDKATDLEYPYRWQLGRAEELGVCEAEGTAYLCLQPGQEVEVTGAIRFVEPPLRRVTAIYAALMHEDVARMHGPYGRQGLAVDFEADDAP